MVNHAVGHRLSEWIYHQGKGVQAWAKQTSSLEVIGDFLTECAWFFLKFFALHRVRGSGVQGSGVQGLGVEGFRSSGFRGFSLKPKTIRKTR